MRKILLSIVAIAAFVTNASAQTYFWQEDFSSYAAGDVPSGGTYNYSCVGNGTKVYADKLAGGTAPEILIGKSNGSFSATVPLSATGSFTLSYNANYDRITVTVSDGATLGDKVKSGNNYSYPVTVASGTSSVTITFSNATSSNVRFDDAKLYQGDAKKPAGLSWGTASRTVTIGADDNAFPTLTNDNNLSVTYSSDNTDVATIAADGTVTIVAAGTAVISAAFAGNADYDAQTVSYTLTVKAEATVDITNTPETAYTVAKAIELITAGEGLDKKVYVSGKIKEVKEVSTSYGNATYTITDGTNDILVYRGYYLGNEKFTAEDQIKVGDDVIVYGKITLYQSTNEITNNQIYSLNGQTAGISNITVSADNNAASFNAAGQRVNASAKGLVIKGGKKFINK